MRLYINQTDFISVIQKENRFSCQPMTLVFGIGMYPATKFDNPKDVVSVINGDQKICDTLTEVFEFHSSFLTQLAETTS